MKNNQYTGELRKINGLHIPYHSEEKSPAPGKSKEQTRQATSGQGCLIGSHRQTEGLLERKRNRNFKVDQPTEGLVKR
jgi:hypothetical protein